MSGMTKKTGTRISRLVAIWSRASRSALTMLAVAGLMLGATSAKATCGSLSGLGSGSGPKLPMLGQAEEGGVRGHDSIVGLWHVVYTAGGEVFFESLDQWHSDGTEFENADLPIAQGNTCFGVWKPTGPHSVKLHHVGWTYDPTTSEKANGTFTLDETNTVSQNGQSYTGTFTFITYDLKGNQSPEIAGTIAATRITVD